MAMDSGKRNDGHRERRDQVGAKLPRAITFAQHGHELWCEQLPEPGLLWHGYGIIGPSGREIQSKGAGVATPILSGGDTAWVLTATCLVLFMTLPGLALFYSGLVRGKNALSILMQCFAITCVVSILWFAVGYSLAFSDGGDAQRLHRRPGQARSSPA